MNFSINYISKITQAKTIGEIDNNHIISEFSTDSRKLIKPESTLFFAIETKRRNGHDFIDSLYQKGFKCFVVSNNYIININKYKDAIFLIVSSPINALQQIASDYRNRFNNPIIAVGGSNGKTIVKEWLFHLLSKHKTVLRSPKSYNSQIGVPLSILMLEKYYEYAIFEAGISEKNEMFNLKNIINPDFGIFTTIGPPHDENFKNKQEKIIEKLLLYKDCKKIIFSSEYEDVIKIGIENNIINKSQLFTWGNKKEDNIKIIDKFFDKHSTNFKIEINNKIYGLSIPFSTSASFENAMHCFATMIMLGFSPKSVIPEMRTLPSIGMRLELHNGINNCLLINDTYNSDIHSLSIALDFLKQQQQDKKSCVILSDILQTGIENKKLYSQISYLLESNNISKFIGIGENIFTMKEVFQKNISETHYYNNLSEFIENINDLNFQDEIILVKGARDFSFEKIINLLELKTHQTVLNINLNAIIHNLNYYKKLLNPKTEIMAMVKAFSYGSGSYEIGSLLEYHNVNYLGVAYSDEGIELRKSGIKLPIMVMAPEIASIQSIINYNLEPEIYNFESLSWIQNYPKKEINIHLKFDTGMHRLGFGYNEIDKLCSLLRVYSNIKVISVFSHFRSADNPNEDDFTKNQIKLFNEMYDKLSNNLKITPKKHILNSAGISRFPQFQYDMVRLGLGLYGVQPSEHEKLPLMQSAKLQTHVIQIKNINKGERIGYGEKCIAKNNMKIAVISIGYADGLRRTLSNNKGKVFINNNEYPIVGNICMDMTIIDITESNIKIGDNVTIFDDKYTINDIAKDMGVISYEVISGISRRVKRQYFLE